MVKMIKGWNQSDDLGGLYQIIIRNIEKHEFLTSKLLDEIYLGGIFELI